MDKCLNKIFIIIIIIINSNELFYDTVCAVIENTQTVKREVVQSDKYLESYIRTSIYKHARFGCFVQP